jgi:hypothetical protein
MGKVILFMINQHDVSDPLPHTTSVSFTLLATGTNVKEKN